MIKALISQLEVGLNQAVDATSNFLTKIWQIRT